MHLMWLSIRPTTKVIWEHICMALFPIKHTRVTKRRITGTNAVDWYSTKAKEKA
jgi:hypothetical protein